MPLQIIRNDITKVKCDAIVNAANTSLRGGGGVDGMIHRAAGPGLLKECITLGGCKTGEAKITRGYKLPCKYVIHTPGPVWRGGNSGEQELLASCYYNSLRLAKEYDCQSVAFPLISSGAYGYPVEEAFQVATKTIKAFLDAEGFDILVYMVIFDRNSLLISKKLFSDIKAFIDDKYVDDIHKDKTLFSNRRILNEAEGSIALTEDMYCAKEESAPAFSKPAKKRRTTETAKKVSTPICEESEYPDLSKLIHNSIDESFSEMLLRKIDEKGIKDSDCYKKANIDRKLFSKIRSNKLYKPSKNTVLAFAIALEMNIEETNDMLKKAGFALSRSSVSDIIIEYFIVNRVYDVFTINDALFSFDQKLLGA